MAKKENLEQPLPDQEPPAAPATAEAAGMPEPPAAHEIIAAIKVAGQSLSPADRDEIIRTVATLPRPASESTPSPYDGVSVYNFVVTYGDLRLEVAAKNDREAWALACDAWKEWPGPKRGKVECVGMAASAG